MKNGTNISNRQKMIAVNTCKSGIIVAPRVVVPINKKQNKSYNLNKLNNKNKNKFEIKLYNKLKPIIKRSSNTNISRRLPHWTLRLTKFDHYISSKELMAASVKPTTAKSYTRSGVLFYEYIKQIRIYQKDLPKIGDLLNNFDIFQLDALIFEFLTKKFNERAVTGGTLKNTACGVLYTLAVDYGISLTCELLPGVRKICKGADNILTDIFGERVIGKYPLLNPILEKMFEFATNKEKFALLLAQRFCLRSQHYCNNRNKNKNTTNNYIKFRDFSFIPDFHNPRAICIATSHDKNNPNLEHMDRVVYCCCKVTKWTCIVHFAKEFFSRYKLRPHDALVQCKTGDMHYSAMLNIVKKLIKKIGLDPSNYGTHSARKGGTTELFLVGKQAIWIQNFGWWNNIGSVMIYIRPNNPDLQQIWGSQAEYIELRASEGEALDVREKQLSQLQTQVNLQNNKRIKGNRTSKIFKKAAIASGSSGAAIKNCSLNKVVSNRHETQYVYTQYGKHAYNVNKGVWKHDAKGKPYMAVSRIDAVKTVSMQVSSVNNNNNIVNYNDWYEKMNNWIHQQEVNENKKFDGFNNNNNRPNSNWNYNKRAQFMKSHMNKSDTNIGINYSMNNNNNDNDIAITTNGSKCVQKTNSGFHQYANLSNPFARK